MEALTKLTGGYIDFSEPSLYSTGSSLSSIPIRYRTNPPPSLRSDYSLQPAFLEVRWTLLLLLLLHPFSFDPTD